jgi:hypothetical protein
MTSALISACNSALAKIAKGPITSLEDEGVEELYCKQFADELLLEMADWTAWPDLIKRAVLAETTNDRPAEWMHAYALPSDFGEPIAIRKPEDAAVLLPELSPPFTLPEQDRYRLGFKIEGRLVYTNVEDATLVYSSRLLEAGQLTPLMRRAFIDELAARLAAPVGKMSANRIEALERKAMMTKLEAIADAENKNERIQPNYMSAAEYAREGYLE